MGQLEPRAQLVSDRSYEKAVAHFGLFRAGDRQDGAWWQAQETRGGEQVGYAPVE